MLRRSLVSVFMLLTGKEYRDTRIFQLFGDITRRSCVECRQV